MAIAAPRAENAAQSAQQAQQIRDKRQATFQSLREERASLLDGEDTKTHRTWFNEARKAAQDARDTARKKSADSTQASTGAAATAKAAATARAAALTALENAQANLDRSVAESGFEAEALSALFATSRTQVETLRAGLRRLADAVTAAGSTARARQADLDAVLEAGLPEATAPVLSAALEVLEAQTTARQERTGTLAGALLRDDETRANLAGLAAQTASAKAEMEVWQAVNAAVGSKSGDRFARIAQSITLDVLVDRANAHLSDLNPRYLLRRAADLALQVEDRDMGHEARATRSLSGGERFLVSLALALALSRMGNRGGLAATLFIDEGFGSLDAASLDLAIDALETLQSQGRQVGVISHVEAMKDRIPVRINVRKQGGGKSAVSVTGGLA
jgi:exonuclease SbcC